MSTEKFDTLSLAQWLLDYEINSHGSSATPDYGLLTVSGKFHHLLTRLVGKQGYHSLLSRALSLAKKEAPYLGRLQVNDDGYLERVVDYGPKPEPADTDDDGKILIGRLLGLLIEFIGENLTLELVRDIWPEAAPDVQHFGTGKIR